MAYSTNIGNTKTNVRGVEEDYKIVAEDREKVEKKIGLSLAKDSRLTGIAAKITEKAKVKSYGELDEASKKKTTGQVGTFGGAAAFKEGWGTLGGSVSAVMNEIEKDPVTKAKYSVSHAENHPYFPTNQKKPEFDKPIVECKWNELPPEIQIYLDSKAASPNPQVQPPAVPPAIIPMPTYNYDQLKGDTQKELLKDYRYKNDSINGASINFIAPDPTMVKRLSQMVGVHTSVSSTTKQAVKDIVNDPTNNRLRTIAKALIIKEMATTNESLKAQLGALLDIIVDRHTSGDHTNIVSKNGDGGVKDKWIDDTVAAGKPIISGPSGHTLRYLNFWAEKRNENIVDAQKHEEWPSLEAARLVMMADLLPPRHHSYDEVMTASIGIKDNVSDALKYQHKSSYEDLKEELHTDKTVAGKIAQDALDNSGAAAITTNNDLENSIQEDITTRNTLQQRKAELQTALNEAADVNKITAAITALTAPPN